MNVIRLGGCTAEPFGSYLKALSVLRLITEQQADGAARGWWDRGSFCLRTELDEAGLIEFFLKLYCPTPIVSPWNGGSGFYPKDRKAGIDAIRGSEDARFAVYRKTIEQARQIRRVGQEKGASKAEEDQRRLGIQLECRNALPNACVEWLDAAVGISAEGERTFAPVLGTGGNEGRLDYTNNFMERIAELLITPDEKTPVEDLLKNALFGTLTSGYQLAAVGQYDPGRAGGYNQGQGVATGDFPANPWNFVLTLEGAVAWAAGLYRRQGVGYRSFLCSPFTVRATPVGYGSSAGKDGELARAEIWAPIWEEPASYREIRAVLREGRASIDGRPAQNGLEFAEAACLLGVDRGISGFVRYNLLKRRGDSYVALPAGRFGVREDRWESDLIRELNPVLEELDRQKAKPAEFESLRRQVNEAEYNALLRGGTAAMERVARATGRLRRRMLVTGKAGRAYSRLSFMWVKVLSGAAEARIAAALASMWDGPAGGMADHLDRDKRDFTWAGADLAERMARTLERRLLIADREGMERNPLRSRYRARSSDITAFLDGAVDFERIEELLFAFTFVDWTDATTEPGQETMGAVWPVYGFLKHLFSADKVQTSEGRRYLKGDRATLAALMAGDVERAAQAASRRLLQAGAPEAEIQGAGGFDGMRLAAALLIPAPHGRAMQRFFETTNGGRQ